MRNSIAIVMVMVSAAGAYAQSATTGAIEGRVIDAATKEPLGGAAVWATGSNGVLQTAMTDGDGSYKIHAWSRRAASPTARPTSIPTRTSI